MEQGVDQSIQQDHNERRKKGTPLGLERALDLLEGARLAIIENNQNIDTVRIRKKDNPKKLLKLLEEARQKVSNTADLSKIKPQTLREYSTLNFRNNIQYLYGVMHEKDDEKERQRVYNQSIVVVVFIIASAVALALGPDGCEKIQKTIHHHQKQTLPLVEPNTDHMSNLWE